MTKMTPYVTKKISTKNQNSESTDRSDVVLLVDWPDKFYFDKVDKKKAPQIGKNVKNDK